MISILGIQIPISKKILYPEKTEVVLAYTKAMRDGKGEAKKILKFM
jgi:hypothetical protein